MKRTALASLLALSAMISSTPALASKKGWATTSDIGAYSLMAVSIGMPIAKKDKQGALQAAGSLALTSAVTEGMKQAFPRTRPDGSDRKSFPSGHTARSFNAAATLYNRQGAAIGIPAFAVASLVGVARVKADKHFWTDVLAGAAIGTASGLLITHNRPDGEPKSALMPWVDSHGGGVSYGLRF
jgi:membrane-associated phospholipid phosphatase